MHAKKLIYTLFVIALIGSSCKKKNITPAPPAEKPFITDVYAVGYKVVNGSTYGICWKNAQQVSVTSDLNSTIYAVLANGSDVYLAGHTSGGATYWKNGEPVYLAQGAQSIVYSIAVSGTDVYAGGTVYKTGDNYGRAVYWKNGVETDLTDGTAQAYVTGIAVNGNYVYTVGQNNLPDNGNTAGASVASCWKNQTLIPLDGTSVFSYGSFAKGIALNGKRRICYRLHCF